MSRDAAQLACRDCSALTLVGLSEDSCAHIATADATPLSPYGEMVARLAGLATYDLHREGSGLRLYQRDHWGIEGRPAGELVYCWRVDVVADHRCGWAFPAAPSLLRSHNAPNVDPYGPPPF